MDFISIALAVNKALKSLFDGGQVGRTEKNAFSFDGNTEGKVSHDGIMYKVSDKTPDLDTLVRVRGIVDGIDAEFTKLDGEVLSVERYDGVSELVLKLGADDYVPLAMVVYDVSAVQTSDIIEEGLYLFYADENNFVSYIEFTETIHPIDPKFLPGVCLPVVELSTVIQSDVYVSLSKDEALLLDATYQNKTPIVCNATIDGFVVSVPLMHIGGAMTGYSGNSNIGNLALIKTDTGWDALFITVG